MPPTERAISRLLRCDPVLLGADYRGVKASSAPAITSPRPIPTRVNAS